MATPADRAVLAAIFNPLQPTMIEDGNEADDRRPHVDYGSHAEVVKKLEIAGIKAAEENKLKESLAHFTEAITLCPKLPEGYNNRAQTLRLMNDTEGALRDLNTAVELSGGEGKAGCQALCQRGLILRLKGEEELALADFQKAAAHGSLFAKTQAAMLNPYAAMCNKMLGGVFTRLQRGEPEDDEPSSPPA